MRYALLLLLCGVVPTLSCAAMQISEVAWMGTAADANDEWIELFNDGVEQDLTGWTLTAQDGQPTITLQGVLGQHAYFLLERTDDASVPDVTADVIYTGALGNDGEVLELKDAAGSVVDIVNGADGWSVGGDNTAKLTLQKSGGAWVTAEPTPKRANAVTSVELPHDEEQSDDTQTATASSPSSVSKGGGSSGGKSSMSVRESAKKEPRLTMELGADRYAVAGVPLTLTASVQDENGPTERAELDWNFGDGTTGSGGEVKHTYKYVGQYVVTVRARGVGSRSKLTAEDRLRVTVEQARVEITDADLYSIALVNEGSRDIDLSRWALAAGKRHFRIPEGTLLAAGGTVRFPASATGLVVRDVHSVALFYPNGARASGGTRSSVVVPITETEQGEEVPPEVLEGEESEYNDEGDQTPLVLSDASIESSIDATSVGAVSEVTDRTSETANVAASVPASGSRLWWHVLGLVALVSVAGAGVILVSREEEDIAYAYDLIEVDNQSGDEVPPPKARRKERRSGVSSVDSVQ